MAHMDSCDMNVRVENSQTVNRQTALLDTMTVSVSMSLETFETLGVRKKSVKFEPMVSHKKIRI